MSIVGEVSKYSESSHSANCPHKWWNCAECIDEWRATPVGKMNWERSKKQAERAAEQRDAARAVRLRKPAKPRPASSWDPVAKAGGKGGPVRKLSPEEIAAEYGNRNPSRAS